MFYFISPRNLYIIKLTTKRAKLLDADWSMKRIFFWLILLCEEGKITRSRLVLRLPSNSLFNREVFFSVIMASRFEIVDEEYIGELKDKSENENKKNSTEW